EPVVARDAEANQELELTLALKIGAPGAFVQLFLEIGKRVLVQFLLAQFQHGLDRRHHAMAARLGQERGVIAFRLIGVGAGEIDELGPPGFEQARPREVFACGDDLVRGLCIRQVAGLVDEDDPAGHGRVPFKSRPEYDAKPVMRLMSGAALVHSRNWRGWRLHDPRLSTVKHRVTIEWAIESPPRVSILCNGLMTAEAVPW